MTEKPRPQWLTNWLKTTDAIWDSVEYREDEARWRLFCRKRVSGQVVGPGQEASGHELWVVFADAVSLGGDWPEGSRISSQGNNPKISFQADVEGIECFGSAIFSSGSALLDRVTFVPEQTTGKDAKQHRHYPQLELTSQGEAIDSRGEVHIRRMNEQNLIAGQDGYPTLKLKAIGSSSGELDWVDVFELGYGHLGALESLSRLRIAFPMRSRPRVVNRRESLQMAKAMEMGTKDPQVRAQRLSRFWDRLSRSMKEKRVGGTSEIVTRFLAFELRREAAEPPESWLLQVSRWFGHGTRLLRPLALWTFGAILSTTAIRLVGHIPDATMLWSLFVDMLVTPVTFIRGTESTLMANLWNVDASTKILITMMRLWGLASIAFLALAVRAYTRSV